MEKSKKKGEGIALAATNENINVSVIMPVFNSERYLEQSLNDLMHQSLEDIEIICVDDGSTDSSPDILMRYREIDKRIKVQRQENLFAGTARNNGLKRAKGKYVIFLDSDDIFHRTMLEELYDKAEKTGCEICICDAIPVSDVRKAGKRHYLNAGIIPRKEVFSYKDIPDSIFRVTTPAPWNMLFRKDFIENNGIEFENTIRGNDLRFFAETIVSAEKISVVDKILMYYRDDAIGSLQTQYGCHRITEQNTLHQIKTFLQERGRYDDVEKAFKRLVLSNNAFILKKIKSEEEARQYYSEVLCSETPLILYDGKDEELLNNLEYQRLSRMKKLGEEAFVEELFNAPPHREQVEIIKRSGVSNPKITIIIPAYNVEKYIAESVDSVLAQTYSDWEMVAVNDASTDNTLDLLKEITENDERVTIVNCPENKGVGHARNVGLDIAKGEFVQFLDSDDWLLPETFEILLKQIEKEHADMVLFEGEIFYDVPEDSELHNSKKDSFYRWKNEYVKPVSGLDFFARAATNGDWRESVCLTLFNAKAIRNIRFIEGIVHEDDIFSVKAILNAKCICVIKGGFYQRRIREDSIMTNKSKLPSAEGRLRNIIELRKIEGEYRCDNNVKSPEIIRGTERLISREIRSFFKAYSSLSKKEKQSLTLSEGGAQVIYNELNKYVSRTKRESKKAVESSKTYRFGRIFTGMPASILRKMRGRS
ncbi:MAG: glycosyltransferase [Bacillota bacterium]|nr:glycosyltransferase [Bacillota bacterium]